MNSSDEAMASSALLDQLLAPSESHSMSDGDWVTISSSASSNVSFLNGTNLGDTVISSEGLAGPVYAWVRSSIGITSVLALSQPPNSPLLFMFHQSLPPMSEDNRLERRRFRPFVPPGDGAFLVVPRLINFPTEANWLCTFDKSAFSCRFSSARWSFWICRSTHLRLEHEYNCLFSSFPNTSCACTNSCFTEASSRISVINTVFSSIFDMIGVLCCCESLAMPLFLTSNIFNRLQFLFRRPRVPYSRKYFSKFFSYLVASRLLKVSRRGNELMYLLFRRF